MTASATTARSPREWHVSLSGDDAGSGVKNLPLCSISEAASADELGRSHEGDPLWFAEVFHDMTRVRAEFPDANPNEACVEVNVRPTVFYPSREGCDFISVRGLVFQHAATPWSPPTTEQIGLLGTNWSKGWIIEDNAVRYSIAAGITLGKYHDPDDHPELDTVEGTGGEDTYHGTIRRALAHGWSLDSVGNHAVINNTVSHCEMAGICGSLGAVRSVIEGNDSFLNNVFVDPAGLSAYDGATEPVRCEDNLFLGASAPSLHDLHSFRLRDFPVSSIQSKAVDEQVFFDCDAGWEGFPCEGFDTIRLGRNCINGLPYENADGSPLVLDHDYLGVVRRAEQFGPGPFVSLTREALPLQIWPPHQMAGMTFPPMTGM